MTAPDDVTKIVSSVPVVPLRRARYWLQAVVYQARRVIATNAAPYDLQSPFQMEVQFLLTATEKAHRWLQKSLDGSGVADDAKHRIELFLQAISSSAAKDLRDILEHDDEYDLGGGRHPEKVDISKEVGEHRFRVSHSITITYREDAPVGDKTNTEGLHILLGGRFDVVAVMSAAGVLAEYLVAQENAANPSGPIANRFPGGEEVPDGVRLNLR
jgi:hypothetical protein